MDSLGENVVEEQIVKVRVSAVAAAVSAYLTSIVAVLTPWCYRTRTTKCASNV
jgi:hypothetical protein